MSTKTNINTTTVGLTLSFEQKKELSMAAADLSLFLKDNTPLKRRGTIWDKLYFLLTRPGAEKQYSTDRDDCILFYDRLIRVTKSLVILNQHMEEMLFKGYQKQAGQ